MRSYLLIQEGIAVEFFETDGDMTEMFHPSWIWIDVTDMEVKPSAGWVFEEGTFSPPPPVQMTKDQAISKQTGLLSEADQLIAPLMDDFVLDDLSDEGGKKLKRLSTYRKELRALDLDNISAIVWPELSVN